MSTKCRCTKFLWRCRSKARKNNRKSSAPLSHWVGFVSKNIANSRGRHLRPPFTVNTAKTCICLPAMIPHPRPHPRSCPEARCLSNLPENVLFAFSCLYFPSLSKWDSCFTLNCSTVIVRLCPSCNLLGGFVPLRMCCVHSSPHITHFIANGATGAAL